MSSPETRLGTPGDARVAARVLVAFAAELAAPTEGEDLLAARLGWLLAREDVVLGLCGPAEAPTGLALAVLRTTSFADGRAALLEELYVAPEYRGEGLGSALLALVVDEARRRGAELLEVPVDEGDTDARRFYERHGCSNRASPHVPGDEERMLRYERDLR